MRLKNMVYQKTFFKNKNAKASLYRLSYQIWWHG